jgi:hypothetical protein
MKTHQTGIYFPIIVLLLLTVSFAAAQDDCPVMVSQALAAVGEACAGIGRNQVCYGNTSVTATTHDLTPLPNFALPGDLSSVLDLESLVTAPLNLEKHTWGVAVMAVQATLPDTLPGQNVTFILFGDTEFKPEASTDARFAAPMQSFSLKTGVGKTVCSEAPRDGVLVQTPQGTKVNFLVNGVELSIGSTAFLTTLNSQGALDVSTLEGEVRVSTKLVAQGNVLATAQGLAPSEPAPFEPEDVIRLPVNLLPETVNIPIPVPGDSDWVESGVRVTAGQTFTVAASGQVNPCANQTIDVCKPYGPDGMTQLGTALQAEPGTASGYPMPDAAIASLIGRIGEGTPFFIGAGGTFTADAEGTLQFLINDIPLENNKGVFYVEINTKNEIPAGQLIGLLDCANQGGISVPSSQPLVFQGGRGELQLDDLQTFVRQRVVSLRYDGKPLQIIAVVGPEDWTDPNGTPGHQMNWYWRLAAPSPGAHELVWTLGDEVLTCNVTVV